MVIATMKLEDNESYDKPKQCFRFMTYLKSKDISLWTKIHVVKVIMCLCESWTVKKAGGQRIDAFELCCWRRLLRVSWTARRSDQSILMEINSEYSLEGLILKPQYFGHLMQRATHWKTLMLGKRLRAGREGGQQRIDGWMASPSQWT